MKPVCPFAAVGLNWDARLDPLLWRRALARRGEISPAFLSDAGWRRIARRAAGLGASFFFSLPPPRAPVFLFFSSPLASRRLPFALIRGNHANQNARPGLLPTQTHRGKSRLGSGSRPGGNAGKRPKKEGPGRAMGALRRAKPCGRVRSRPTGEKKARRIIRRAFPRFFGEAAARGGAAGPNP